jgi:hypothetical protein
MEAQNESPRDCLPMNRLKDNQGKVVYLLVAWAVLLELVLDLMQL